MGPASPWEHLQETPTDKAAGAAWVEKPGCLCLEGPSSELTTYKIFFSLVRTPPSPTMSYIMITSRGLVCPSERVQRSKDFVSETQEVSAEPDTNGRGTNEYIFHKHLKYRDVTLCFHGGKNKP